MRKITLKNLRRRRKNGTRVRQSRNSWFRENPVVKERLGGGGANTKTAVIIYVRNIAAQILNSIENKENNSIRNTKYSRLSNSKRTLYAPLLLSMKIDYDNFKLFSDIMINERNSSIHPPTENLPILASNCKNLIVEHNLEREMALESKILQYGINTPSKRVTRSMSSKLKQGY